MNYFLTFTLIIISLTPSWGQYKILTTDQLREDYDIFRGVLESMHGGLYRYRTKAEIDNYFDLLEGEIDQPMNELDYFHLLAPGIAKIQCGHTGIIPSKGVGDKVFREGKLLPIQLYFHNQNGYFVKSLTEESIPMTLGDEVLAINGISMDSLVRYSLMVNAVGDGWIETGKMNLLNRVFNKYFALYFSQPDEYEITYADANADVKTFLIKALVKDNMVNLSPTKQQISRNIDLHFHNAKTAVLTVKSFDDWKEDKKRIKFIPYLEEAFQKIDSAKISNLVIDVRDNGGGDDEMGLKLFSYLYDQPIVEFNEIAFKTKRLHYAKYSDYNKFKFWFAKAFNKYRKVNDSTYHIVNTTTQPHLPSEPQFTGNLAVLINGRSYSTTADFAALMKSYEIGTLVGEETSGGYYGNTSGAMFTYTLPNSGIKIIVPFMGYWTNVVANVDPGRGTIPDYPIVPSVEDVLDGRDVQMDFALELLEGHEK